MRVWVRRLQMPAASMLIALAVSRLSCPDRQRKFSRFPPPPVHNAAMRKRVHIALAVLLVILAGVIVWQVLRSQDRSRKEYALCWLQEYSPV